MHSGRRKADRGKNHYHFSPFAFGSPERAMTLSGKLGDVILQD